MLEHTLHRMYVASSCPQNNKNTRRWRTWKEGSLSIIHAYKWVMIDWQALTDTWDQSIVLQVSYFYYKNSRVSSVTKYKYNMIEARCRLMSRRKAPTIRCRHESCSVYTWDSISPAPPGKTPTKAAEPIHYSWLWLLTVKRDSYPCGKDR